MSPEKAREYQQVAALVCLDLDVLLEVSQDQGMTVDRLRDHIRSTCKMKDEAISDPAARESRYACTSAIFHAFRTD